MPLFNIGFVIFPDLTQLDFTGPLQVLSRLPQSATHIVAKSAAPVPSDCGVGLVPTHTFANCPPLDLICVPGGNLGVVDAFCDRDTIEFVRRQARTAKYVTSVCTGAIILGVAGLLKGRRATTHWAFVDLLPLVGATHEKCELRVAGERRCPLATISERDAKRLIECQGYIGRRLSLGRESLRVKRRIEQRASNETHIENAATPQMKLDGRVRLEDHRHAGRDHLGLRRRALRGADQLQQLPRVVLDERDGADPDD
jgi:putative intracellular protease/amidase